MTAPNFHPRSRAAKDRADGPATTPLPLSPSWISTALNSASARMSASCASRRLPHTGLDALCDGVRGKPHLLHGGDTDRGIPCHRVGHRRSVASLRYTWVPEGLETVIDGSINVELLDWVGAYVVGRAAGVGGLVAVAVIYAVTTVGRRTRDPILGLVLVGWSWAACSGRDVARQVPCRSL